MMYKIEYSIYKFEGKLLDLETYTNLKETFKKNSYLDFPPPKTYYEEHEGESLFFLVPLCICILISFILVDDSWTVVVFMISFMFLFVSIISQFSQFISFQKAKSKKKSFFTKLKIDIIKSNDYSEFIKLQNQK